MLNSIQQQGGSGKNYNNSIYTHQNLVRQKRTKNKQIKPQHTKFSDLNELK